MGKPVRMKDLLEQKKTSISIKKRFEKIVPWYYPLQVDSKKREDICYDVFKSLPGRGFFMAKKGQTVQTYTEE